MKQFINKPAALLLALSGLLVALPAASENQKVEKTFSVKSGGTFNLDSEHGSIEVESWNKQKVDVVVKKRARNKERLAKFKVRFEQKGNDVFVDGEAEGSGGNRVSVEYIIKVPKSYNLNMKTGGGSIQVDDINGNVKVDTSGGSISIGNVGGGNVTADTSGGSIRVGDVDGNLMVDTSGGSIKIGKVKGTSKVETSGGSIVVEEGGADLSADTSGGSIKIGPVNGKVSVDTSGGSIHIGMAQGDVNADTSGGSIKVDGSMGKVKVDTSGGSIFVGSSGGPVLADTSGGSIKILQAKGSIEADTAGGKIEAEMVQTDNSVDTHVDLESAGGSITLYLPKNIEATVSAKLEITRSARRDYRIYSDFPLTIKGVDSDEVTAKGKINGGGDRIRLETTNGDIHIKMLDK